MNKLRSLTNTSLDSESYTGNQQPIIISIFSFIKAYILILLWVVNIPAYGQETDSSEFVQYTYPNGQVSSEGYLEDGQPEGYWKAYYPSGILKSEGNRVNHFLDGPWKFYNEEGQLETVIRYTDGQKNGIRETWRDSVLVAEEPYVNNKQQGLSKYFYPDGKIKKWIPFERGREQGRGFEFDEDGKVIALLTYKSGVLTQNQEINRTNRLGLKRGVWMEFHRNMNIRVEGTYKDDLKHGFWKYYQPNGNLIRVERWIMGVLQEEDQETAKVEIRREIHESTGALKSKGAYQNGLKEGVHQQFDEDGNPIGAQLYHEDILLAEGMYDERGRKQGEWKFYYPDGTLKAIGDYVDDYKNNQWKYYFQDSTLEQVGRYILDAPDGEWNWYFNSGELRKRQMFVDGLASGEFIEYNDSNEVIAEGQFIDGLRTGIWKYYVHNVLETGEFVQDAREGRWTITWTDIDQLREEGSWSNGLKEGTHVMYYPNGNIRRRGRFVGGQKDGTWEYFAENGARIVTVTYELGEEVEYNGRDLGDGRR